jgi:hypothetical protein
MSRVARKKPVQETMVDLRSETRPFRDVVSWRHVSRWKSVPLLECGHEGDSHIGDGDGPKRKRCTLCGAYGDDNEGLRFKMVNKNES